MCELVIGGCEYELSAMLFCQYARVKVTSRLRSCLEPFMWPVVFMPLATAR